MVVTVWKNSRMISRLPRISVPACDCVALWITLMIGKSVSASRMLLRSSIQKLPMSAQRMLVSHCSFNATYQKLMSIVIPMIPLANVAHLPQE